MTRQDGTLLGSPPARTRSAVGRPAVLAIPQQGGTTLGLASGHTIWLDDNAAGWGWFIDPTPRNDVEFTTPGNQGEQRHMDLLTVLEHELGHLLGYDHEAAGVMADTLQAGMRRAPTTGEGGDWSATLDLSAPEPALTKRRR
jgi:hypothetical protein